MWDFEHSPHRKELDQRYALKWMLPSACADQLASGESDIGLIPIAALPANPQLRILPGCVIASKGKVRSLLLVRRAGQKLSEVRTVAADTASRTTVAHSRILFRQWGNPSVGFVPMAADLDAMLKCADAAVVIGDPALMALEDETSRRERTGEELVYHDLATEWKKLTGLPFVSAVWCIACSSHAFGGGKSRGADVGEDALETIAADFLRSRDHGMANIDALAEEWTGRIALSSDNIRAYLTENIHYVLDGECLEGMKVFFRMAAEAGILPEYRMERSLRC